MVLKNDERRAQGSHPRMEKQTVLNAIHWSACTYFVRILCTKRFNLLYFFFVAR